MITRHHISILALVCLLAAPQLAAGQTFFSAHLTSAQAGVDVEDADPVGTAALALTDEGLHYYVTVDGLTGGVNAAHFHREEIGVSGGVVQPIVFEGTRASGLWTGIDDETMTALLMGQLYINVHTAAFPGGEIRGQVLPTSGTSLAAALTNEQETEEVNVGGSGTAVVQLTDFGAIYHVTVADLTGTLNAAHFHNAQTGVSGGVVRAIPFEGNTAFGVWTASDDQALTDDLTEDLLLGNLYVNVHTGQFPAGELRGQLHPNGGWGFTAELNAENSTGDVTSDGLGTGSFTLTDAGLIYRVTVDGLTGPIAAAHFHQAAAGADGGVVRGIEFEGATSTGIWRPGDAQALTPELIQALVAGEIYVNVHTAQHGAGEIRGQVLLDSGTHLTAALDAEQPTGNVSSDGSGTASLSLTDEGVAYRVTVSGLTGEITAAHFHAQEAGANGGVVRAVQFEGTTATGMWTSSDDQALTDSLFVALLTGGLYLNVHTAQYPAGEIRGQVLLSSGAGMQAMLTNEQQSAEVTQEGGGTASATLTDAGLVYRATVAGLSGDIAAAHFHTGAAGENGGVLRSVTFEGQTAQGVWRPMDDQALVDSLISDLATGDVYLNVHTAQHGSGEIRGQMSLAGGIGRAVVLGPQFEPGDVASDGHGAAAITLTGAGLVYDATVSGTTGPITAAHFHQAALGTGGGVLRGVTFEGSNTAGIWRASDEQSLDGAAVQAFFNDELYLNVHTALHPGGELRGQLDAVLDVLPTAAEPVGGEVPEAFGLAQNFPNPFNPVTTITFDLDRSATTTLAVYNTLGQRVALMHDGHLGAGRYEVRFNGAQLPSGVYFYRLESGGQRETRSMLLLK